MSEKGLERIRSVVAAAVAGSAIPPVSDAEDERLRKAMIVLNTHWHGGLDYERFHEVRYAFSYLLTRLNFVTTQVYALIAHAQAKDPGLDFASLMSDVVTVIEESTDPYVAETAQDEFVAAMRAYERGRR